MKKEIPQNYLLQKPWAAFVIITVFGFLFTLIYTPFDTAQVESQLFMGKLIIYGLMVGSAAFIATTWLVNPFICKKASFWTIGKELLSFAVILFAMGLTVYFVAFLLEPTAGRWNFHTFLDSFKYAVFICFLPYIFFSLVHAPFWFSTLPIQEEFFNRLPAEKPKDVPLLNISSKLKKESLEFYLSELLCISSEGNYVVFYLSQEGKLHKKIIRNSMNEIEEQLKMHACLLRVHRAFLVNLKKISQKRGNALGYRLRLNGLDLEVPVSRNKVREFEEKFAAFR
ncbi:LytTR family DNA-binding domain-containing protein [Algoriphagus antarcticus]|uniref:LytTR family DNA-binding domain-containing protein n=1 Tax=Algoriphagus antarcticus TaxID=238540 RepID=UPI002012BA5A|nr:LytTR family DNA-binding domain-containing protein [Algoriphagus antarcticus]